MRIILLREGSVVVG